MAQSVLYVRNTRPNALLIRVGGIKYTVERRGSREDSAALPGDWREDPVVASFMQRGYLEEISKDSFMALGSRPEDEFVEERGKTKRVPGPTHVPLKERMADDVFIPINPEDHRQPTVITDENLRKSANLRSPRPEFASEVPSTSEDLKKIEDARRQAEASPSQVDFPEDKTEQLQLQVTELTNLVQQLLANQGAETPKKAAAKKAPAKRRGRQKATDPMSPEGKEEHTSEAFMEQ